MGWLFFFETLNTKRNRVYLKLKQTSKLGVGAGGGGEGQRVFLFFFVFFILFFWVCEGGVIVAVFLCLYKRL